MHSADPGCYTARLRHGELAYRQVGSLPLPPLLLIHGWGGASRYWLPAMRALSDAFRCYAPDLPGFGLSSPLGARTRQTNGASPDVYSHRGLAEIVLEFMDVMGIAQADVIGHSYGSGVAIALAATQPERVRRLIISNFSTFRNELERRMIALMHGVTGLMVKARKFPFARSDGFAKLLGSRYFHRLPDDMQVLRDGLDDFMRMDERTANLTVKASLGWDTPHALARLPMPVMLIHCRNDQIMPPRNAEYTAGLAPHGSLVWIDACGHLPMVEKTDEFVRIVRRFLLDDCY
ncbi:MAG: alpha/beta hydrolase [Thermoflexales bacterium]|nr:alpha/beta hydrolase [Thermoflexales bacterium]MDW8351945.1 alpha/beta hydrolase [Anaerolineae bacterium]